MNAKEFIAHLAPVDLDRLALIFNYLGDHAHEARLLNGGRLHDLTDFAAFFHELASASKFTPSTEVLPRVDFRTRPQVTPRDNLVQVHGDFCPDCGHIHIDGSECGFPIGGGRICRCERAVPA
jgi:hypothetical protein